MKTGEEIRIAHDISIHAPPRGATPHWSGMFVMNDFNSRPSARGDELRHIAAENALFISIHAPPRGATPHVRRARSRRNISIHAPPRGATVKSNTTWSA